MKRKVTVEGKGFHNVDDITFSAEVIDHEGHKYAVLDERQHARLQRHFCGVAGCCCSSWPTAHPDSPRGKFWIRVAG